MEKYLTSLTGFPFVMLVIQTGKEVQIQQEDPVIVVGIEVVEEDKNKTLAQKMGKALFGKKVLKV